MTSYSELQQTERRAKTLERLSEALAEPLTVPPPVTDASLVPSYRGNSYKLSNEAFELARQVYYLSPGTFQEAAAAIVAANLSETDDLVRIVGRLKVFWRRQNWAQRSHRSMVAIRDANADGGVFRSDRTCVAVTTGGGPVPAGLTCRQSALPDGPYCFHHDPRPEYVERRRVQTEKLVRARLFDLVPLPPFSEWLKAERVRIAREPEHRHFNDEGWGRLARKLGIDPSIMPRLVNGHTGKGKVKTHVKARSVVKYLGNVETTFEDIYGMPVPVSETSTRNQCPQCAKYKNHESSLCRECHDGVGVQCTYVSRAGRRCDTLTEHESGVCYKCRKIVFRVAKPRLGLPPFLTDDKLIYALDEYRRHDNLAWIAGAMWQVNIGGVADHYASIKSLRQELAKKFAARGWKSKADVESAYQALVAEHGEPRWPDTDSAPLTGALLPGEPFNLWLASLYEVHRSYLELSKMLKLPADYISRRVRGEQSSVKRSVVIQALKRGEGQTTIDDLYSRKTVA